jgi:hypothetical protein
MDAWNREEIRRKRRHCVRIDPFSIDQLNSIGLFPKRTSGLHEDDWPSVCL